MRNATSWSTRPRAAVLIGGVLIAAALAAGCGGSGGGGGSSSPPSSPPPSTQTTSPSTSTPSTSTSTSTSSASDLSGKWNGTYSGAYTGTFTLTWQQSGSKLSGTIDLSQGGANSVNGTVNGGSIKFGTVGGPDITYTGSASGSSMAGSYNTPGGGGSWSANRTS
jgi:hypothetical protein